MISRLINENLSLGIKKTVYKILYIISDFDFTGGISYEEYMKNIKQGIKLEKFEQREIINIDVLIPVLQACVLNVVDYDKYQSKALNDSQRDQVKCLIAKQIYKDAAKIYYHEMSKIYPLLDDKQMWVRSHPIYYGDDTRFIKLPEAIFLDKKFITRSIITALFDNYQSIFRTGLLSHSFKNIFKDSKPSDQMFFSDNYVKRLIYHYYSEDEKPNDVLLKIKF